MVCSARTVESRAWDGYAIWIRTAQKEILVNRVKRVGERGFGLSRAELGFSWLFGESFDPELRTEWLTAGKPIGAASL